MERIQLICTFIECFVTFAVASGSHSLVFLSTGLVGPHNGPSIEQLTVFDGVSISYCDSQTKREQFKPRLQNPPFPDFKNCESANYDILDSIHDIQDQTNATVDVVQRRRGCSQSADGNISGFETWAVNGLEFLTFDPLTLKWMSKIPLALPVEHLWNSEEARARSYAFSVIIKEFCPKLIQQITLRSVTKHTELFVFAKPSENGYEAQLRCHLTTTDKSVKSVHLIGDGVSSVIYMSVMGPVPSGDEAVILRLKAGIFLRHSRLTYGCNVQTEGHNVTVYWNGNTIDGKSLYHVYTYKTLTAVLGFIAMITLSVLMGFAMKSLYTYIKMRRRPPPPPPGPELIGLFESFIQSPTINPISRNILLSFIYGTTIPERYQNTHEEWLEMVDRENYFDPEFYGGRV